MLSMAFGMTLAAKARANPVDTFGFGARSTALGGAVVADVEDFSANYYNPAGLVRRDDIRLESGYLFVAPFLRINGRDTGVDNVQATTAGLVVPARIGTQLFAIGLGLHLNDQRVSRTRSLPAAQPRWEMYDNRPHRLSLAANLAWAPFSWLRFGGGISFMATSENQLSVEGEIPLVAPERGSSLRHTLDTKLINIRYPQVGVQVEPNDEWSFGLVYRGEFELGLALDAQVNADVTLGATRVPAAFLLSTQSVNTFLPQQVSFGASWRPMRGFRASAEITWADWSAYKTSIGFTDVVLDLEVPPQFEGLVSNPGNISGSRPIPAGFRDRFVPRVGVEWRALTLSWLTLDVRGGYFYEHTPVPAQTALTNFIDTDRHAFSAGVGVALTDLRPTVDGTLFIDVTAQYSYLTPRDVEKASLLDPTGSYRATGSLVGISMNAGVTFQ